MRLKTGASSASHADSTYLVLHKHTSN